MTAQHKPPKAFGLGLASLRRAYALVAHADEIRFLGRCDCEPSCELWAIEFRGERIPATRGAYDRLPRYADRARRRRR